MKHATFGAVVTALLLCGGASAGETLTGPATVIDGDTLRIHGTVIGLLGVAAPGLDQTCEGKRGRTSACGKLAARALAERIGHAAISCETRGPDRSHRVLAVCRREGEDLNAWMVASGWAVSERFSDKTYYAQETRAWGKRRGIWAGVFEDPTGRRRADYASAGKPTAASDATPRPTPVGTAPVFKITGLGN